MLPTEYHRLLEESWIVGVEHHSTLGSTNDRAVELAKSGDAQLPLLVIADEQTAGRGRGGNRWWTAEGSLAFSVLFDSATNDVARFATPLLGLAAGLAVVDAVRPLLDGHLAENHKIGLHWPNDVFAAGKKIAGILVEVLPDRKIVLGIGLNVNNSVAAAPSELQSLAATLFDLTQIRHDRISILISILNHLKRYLDLIRGAPEKLAAEADAVCLQKDKRLHLQWGQSVVSGFCGGIDGTGAILLETDDGLKAFASGVLLKR
jgi:BirA family biotin operon repressor/biotin-[acetyl-CoA-carboxylase] ligase